LKEGDIVLASIPQADGKTKSRPAVALRSMPPFGDLLICGVSTQLHQEVVGFDDRIEPRDRDYPSSGLKAASLIRLGFLAVVPKEQLGGSIGELAPERYRRLLTRLCQHLQAQPSR